jgi:hypothetical protein
MADMMAIVSKAVFEKDAPRAKVGAVLPMRVYRSASKPLMRLDKESRLFLVTVRPPNEALWLVAVLEGPEFDGAEWHATRNTCPVTDITGLIGSLKFESGKGLQAKKGALGMSLQTPRVLTPDDVELLLKAAGAAKATKAAPRVRAPGPINLTAHEAASPLHCLCMKCLAAAPETLERDGASYFRASVEAQGRILWFWVPGELKDDLPAVAQAVQERLQQRLKPIKPDGAAGEGDDEVDGDED